MNQDEKYMKAAIRQAKKAIRSLRVDIIEEIQKATH